MSRSLVKRTRARGLTLAAAVLLLLGAPDSGTAEVDAASSEPMVRLEQQLLDLQRQMVEMESRHAEEMNALREEIRALCDEGALQVAAAQNDLADLRRRAEAEAARAEAATEEEQEAAFTAKGLSLQALNPEISVTGDMLATYRNQEGAQRRSDFRFRSLGLHLESLPRPLHPVQGSAFLSPAAGPSSERPT